MATKTPKLEGPSLAAVNAGAGPHFDFLDVGHPDGDSWWNWRRGGF